MFLFVMLPGSKNTSRLGRNLHQGNGSAALQGLGMQGIGKGWDHFVLGRDDEWGYGAGYLFITGIM